MVPTRCRGDARATGPPCPSPRSCPQALEHPSPGPSCTPAPYAAVPWGRDWCVLVLPPLPVPAETTGHQWVLAAVVRAREPSAHVARRLAGGFCLLPFPSPPQMSFAGDAPRDGGGGDGWGRGRHDLNVSSLIKQPPVLPVLLGKGLFSLEEGDKGPAGAGEAARQGIATAQRALKVFPCCRALTLC